MSFNLPIYHAPDSERLGLANAADTAAATLEADGIAPEGYHSTTMYPEYFRIDGLGAAKAL